PVPYSDPLIAFLSRRRAASASKGQPVLKFILRRIGVSALVLLGASFLMYMLVINSGDPLKDLRESNAPNREQLMAQRAELLRLDDNPFERYWDWLSGVLGCFTGN